MNLLTEFGDKMKTRSEIQSFLNSLPENDLVELATKWHNRFEDFGTVTVKASREWVRTLLPNQADEVMMEVNNPGHFDSTVTAVQNSIARIRAAYNR